MSSKFPLKVCLGLGLTSYCLVILVSQDASVTTLALMGIMSLSLSVISMGMMWHGWTHPLDVKIIQDSNNSFIK
jgi:hypothetical protein